MEEGSYSWYKAPYDERMAKFVREKQGADVEIFNEVFAEGKIPSVLA
jgi:hypothetical protein